MAVEGLYKKEVSKRKERNMPMFSVAIDGPAGKSVFGSKNRKRKASDSPLLLSEFL